MDFNLYNLNNLKKFSPLFSRLKSANKTRFKSLAKNSLNWLVPRVCIGCKRELAQDNHPCCRSCYATLPFQSHCCDHCGQSYSGNTDYCGRCIGKPPPFDACFCPFRYEAPVDQQIKAFKYHARPELAKTLAKLLFIEIQANALEMPELLIPVPMHISKLRQRGYNQSLLLTQQLSKLMELPYDRQLLRKPKVTPAQADLTLKQRQSNLRGSFEFIEQPIKKNQFLIKNLIFINKKRAKTKVRSMPKHVAIVDDVFTTGATASEIANVLKRNGVDYVQIWGIAHTI